MRIGIDNISPGESTGIRAPGGMRSYLQSLLLEFSRQHPQHQLVLFTPSSADPLLTQTPSNVEIVRLPFVPINRSLRIIYQQTFFALAIARHNLDVLFATATITPLLLSVPVVLAVQFLQFYENPDAYGRLRTTYLKLFLPLSLRKAKKSIIFTETAKRDLIRWTGVPSEKIEVVPHGLSPKIWKMASLSLQAPERTVGSTLTQGRPYVLYVSATYGYKNHARLIRSFALLKQRLNIPHVLLLVGSEVSVTFAELRAIAKDAGVADDVLCVGQVSPVEQVYSIYLGADMSIFPSLYETFGFPPLEAMACGCPVITSKIGSMAELAGDAAILIDPYDPNSMASAMEQMLTDGQLRATLIERGLERAKFYTRERSATHTLSILEEVGRD